MRSQMLLLAFICILSLGCKKKNVKPQDSETKWSQSPLKHMPGQGHEVLTYLALRQVQHLNSDFFELPHFQDSGAMSENPFLIGLYATDSIKVPMTNAIVFPGLLAYYLANRPAGIIKYEYEQYWKPGAGKLSISELRRTPSWSWKEWMYESSFLAFHFMRDGNRGRDSLSGKFPSLMEACRESHEVITRHTDRALALYFGEQDSLTQREQRLTGVERRREAQKWLGVGLHTIQDSFSPAHTFRDSGKKILTKNDFVVRKSNPHMVCKNGTCSYFTCENYACRYIRDVCTDADTDRSLEKDENERACTHRELNEGGFFEDDSIWLSPKLPPKNPSDYESNLRPLAKEAVGASARYLATIHAVVYRKQSRSLINAFLRAELPCCPAGSACNDDKALLDAIARP